MSTELTSLQSAPAAPVSRRARVTRATRPPKGKGDEPTHKVSFYLSADVCKRLGVAASMEETDKSTVVENVLKVALKRWVVSDRAKSADRLDRAGEEDRESEG
jgi:hypothetical protein